MLSVLPEVADMGYRIDPRPLSMVVGPKDFIKGIA